MISVPQWAAERPVDAAPAARLIGRAFPALRGLPVEPLSAGWDNTVHLVGGRWVFRFPRRTQALPGFRRELAVLPRPVCAARWPDGDIGALARRGTPRCATPPISPGSVADEERDR